jgi:protease II
MHEGQGRRGSSNIVDPYHWAQNPTERQENEFIDAESRYTRVMLGKYDLLEKHMLREFDHYQRNVSSVPPIRVDDYVYYRNLSNPADALTLYRFPVVELQKFGFTEG